ncbi:MAG: hypothetical protein ACT4QC_03540 [Planctomycetaceae bacterium]
MAIADFARRRLLGCLTASIVAGLGAPGVAADFDSVADSLYRVLHRSSVHKVLIVVKEERHKTAWNPMPDEVAGLREQFVACCRDLRIKITPPPAADAVPESTLARLPESADWQPLRQTSRADGVVVVTWKTTRSRVVARVSLLDGEKLAWSTRASARRETANSRKPQRRQSWAALSGANNPLSGSPASGLSGSAGRQSGWPGRFAAVPGTSHGATVSGQGTSTTAAAGSTAAAGGTTAGMPALNEKIYEFVSNSLGQQVGDGECYTLAVDALEYAGAEPAIRNDFGTEVPLSQLQPGDVLQFWSARLVSPVLGTWQLGTPGHTAVVGEVAGLVVTVYQQNINSVKRVRRDVLDLSSLVSGQIIGYRAVRSSR